MKPQTSKSTSSVLFFSIFAAFLIAMVGALYLFISSSKSAGHRDGDERDETLSRKTSRDVAEQGTGNRRLEAKVSLLNARQNRLEGDLRRLESRTDDRNASAGGEEGALSSEERKRLTVQKMERQTNLLADTLQKEKPDPAWSSTANESIKDTLTEMGVLSSFDADCKTSMCRVDMVFSDKGLSGEHWNLISRNLPWNGAVFFMINDNGENGFFYLSREGYSLPREEEM